MSATASPSSPRRRSRRHPAVSRLEYLDTQVAGLRRQLLDHPIYHAVTSRAQLRGFMAGHVFAVWDFMALVKRLQRDLTGVAVPWLPAPSAEAARFINQVVLAEESDVGPGGAVMSHLEVYLTAMREVGADTGPITAVLDRVRAGVAVPDALTAAKVAGPVGRFVIDTMTCAARAPALEVAAEFLFGREDVIPDMFLRMLEHWEPDAVPHFAHYLRRHIELDSDEHGPIARRLLARLAGDDLDRWHRASRAAQRAIRRRIALWDGILADLPGR